MINFLAIIGGVFVILSIAGALGIGDFHVYYGPDAKAWHREKAGQE